MSKEGATREVSYAAHLTAVASERGDDIDLYLVSRDGTEVGLSWSTLESRANQIARRLRRQVQPGEVVAIALPNEPLHILATLASWKLGARVLPLRSDLPPWEFDRLLDLAGPAACIAADSRHRNAVTPAELEATAGDDDTPLPDQIPSSTQLVASSGSTGTPKLIAIPARGVIGGDAQAHFSVGADRGTTLVVSPLYHVNGFAFAAPNLLEGKRVFVMERFDARQAVRLVQAHQVTHTVMVPTMLQRIAALDDVVPEQLVSLETVIYGGATIPGWVVDRWLELIPPDRFVFLYGSSERLAVCSMTGKEWPAHRGSTGKPMDADMKVVGPGGETLGPGHIGELYFRPPAGRALFHYIGRDTPKPTPDGYLSLGDMGSVDEEGYVYIADRRNDMIVTGGANVFPAEVEAALSEHPQVVDQVVIGLDDTEWGRRVHAIVEPVDITDPPDVEALRQHCRDRLAAYKVPKSFEVVERVPRTAAGKVNRAQMSDERGGQR